MVLQSFDTQVPMNLVSGRLKGRDNLAEQYFFDIFMGLLSPTLDPFLLLMGSGRVRLGVFFSGVGSIIQYYLVSYTSISIIESMPRVDFLFSYHLATLIVA